jgi:hypothetical protein
MTIIIQSASSPRDRAAIEAIPAIRQKVMQSADAAEGIRSFVERRAAVFQGR